MLNRHQEIAIFAMQQYAASLSFKFDPNRTKESVMTEHSHLIVEINMAIAWVRTQPTALPDGG